MDRPKFTPKKLEVVPLSGSYAIRMPYGDKTYYGAHVSLREKELAYMFAAAPEMYEALKRFTEYGDTFRYKNGERNPYEQAVDALAKAEGRPADG